MQRLYYRHNNGEKFRVLDKGEITERGTHEELLKRKGQYYRLWEMQQGNFAVNAESEKTESGSMIEDAGFDDEDTVVYT